MCIDDSRRARVPPTHPAAIFTLGIFTRTDGPYGDGVVDLAGRRVGIPRGTAQDSRSDDPVPRFAPFDSTADGIRALLERRFAAVIVPVPVAQYWIRRLGTDALRMQATLPMRVPFGIAASADAAPLAGILDAVASRVDAPIARPACLPPAGGGSSACASCHPAKRSGRDAVRCWSGMGPRGSTGAAGSAPGMKNGPVERSAGPSVRLVLMRGVEPPTY